MPDPISALRLGALLALALLGACASNPPPEADPPVRPPAASEGGDANSHLVLAEIALQRGDYHVASREYAAAAQLSTDAALASQATRVAFASSQNEFAAQSARRWLMLDTASADARRFLGVVALRLNRLNEASDQFDRLVRTSYETPAAGFLDLATALSEEENAYGVYRLLSDLSQRHPKVAEARYARSAAALRAFNYKDAVDSGKRAVALSDTLTDAKRVLARALVVSGSNDAGIDMARRDATASSEPDAKIELALLLIASERDAEARSLLTSLLEQPEARPEALRTLATLELGDGNLDAAKTRFEELIGTGRYATLAYYLLGSIHERRKDELEAVRNYARVTSGPYASDAQIRAARLLASSGAADKANELLNDYVVENPDAEVEITIGRARLLADEGDSATALELLDSALQRYPDSEPLRYSRAVTLERLERIDDALAQLEQLVEGRPRDPVALNALGYTLAEHNRELKRAKSLIGDALKMTPDNPAVQDSMGWVQYRLGKNRDALKWLERAFESEHDGEIAAHVGEVYWALGERTRAREIWEKALAEDPDHRYLRKTVQRHPDGVQ